MSDKIREAFEEWRSSSLHYDGVDAEDAAWEAWQAALAQQPATALPADVRALLEELAQYAPPEGVIVAQTAAMAMGRKAKRLLAAAPAAPVAVRQEPVDADALAASLAPMVTEWVESGLSMGTDWRHGLARVIALRIRRLAAQPAAEQPDTVAVPRELLERAMYAKDGRELVEANRELRALLAGGEV